MRAERGDGRTDRVGRAPAARATARTSWRPSADADGACGGRQRPARALLATAPARRRAALRALVERIPAVVYEAEPGADGRWHYVSPYVETMLGYPPEDWIADPDLWARPPAPRGPRDGARAGAAPRPPGSACSLEYRMVARDGSVVWVHDDAFPRDHARGAACSTGC